MNKNKYEEEKNDKFGPNFMPKVCGVPYIRISVLCAVHMIFSKILPFNFFLMIPKPHGKDLFLRTIY